MSNSAGGWQEAEGSKNNVPPAFCPIINTLTFGIKYYLRGGKKIILINTQAFTPLNSERLDYSELVVALQENKKGKANEILEEVLPRLKDYLIVTMNADELEAEECAHQAFMNVYEQILKENIQKEKYIFSYLIRACRNEYLSYAKNQHRFNSPVDENLQLFVEPADQIKNLLDQDRQRVLEEWLEMLEEDERELIEYFINNPDATTKEVSKKFNISGANVRTRKSRITSRLHHCFKMKWED